MKKPKLVFGTPWNSPFYFTQTHESLMQLERPDGWDTEYVIGRGHSSARRHIDICEKALRAQASYILILGSDQLYPTDLLCRLTQRVQEGYEVVTALVPTRGFLPWQNMMPFQPLAWRLKTLDELGPDFKYQKRRFRSLADDSDMVHVIKPEDGEMQRVHFQGSGCLLFHRDHLLALKPPWFYETVQVMTQVRIANMDCRFVARLTTEAHATVWCDTTIKIKHLHIFSIDDSFPARFADWALEGGNPDPALVAWRDPFRDGLTFMQTNGIALPPDNEERAHATPTTLPGSFFDAYRRDYATMPFAEHQRLYSIIERVYPDQTHFNVKAIEEFFQELISHNIVPRVLEIGGWRGELANSMLSQFNDIASWHNIEICAEAVAKHVCSDQFARYTCGTGNDFFWNETPNWIQMFNTLVLSHVVEHMRLQDFASTMAFCAQKGIDYLYLDIPHITDNSHITWRCCTSTHMLEGGWQDIESILTANGYSRVSGETTPRVYASERGMVALKKEQGAYAVS